MEQSRLIIAIVISFAIFLAWSVFFAPKKTEKAPETAQQQTEQQQEVQPSPSIRSDRTEAMPSVEKETIAEAPVVQANESRPARTISVETDLYRITLSEKGAGVVGMILKKYKETNEADSPEKELMPSALTNGTLHLSAAEAVGQDLSEVVFTSENKSQNLMIQDQPLEINFSYRLPTGVIIGKKYRFHPNSYLIDMDVTLRNSQSSPLTGTLALELQEVIIDSKKRFGFMGPSGLIDDKLKQIAIKKIPENSVIDGAVKWIAIETTYFMSSIICPEPLQGKMVLSYADNLMRNQLVFDLNGLPSMGTEGYHFLLFLGPKNWSMLRSYGNELARAINFGWFDILAKPCLWFMNFIHKFIPNYGVAIIILTIITRLIFWPLTQRSYKGMSEMRKLQPLMKEIREKYKDDKARLNQETMALYRTYKINPMSGCLPMIIQLPVFFALYRMLYSAIELRHAPFFGWIQDLSAPDRLFHFGFKIPFMEPPYGIPVLTIIMGATMLLQQKMTPTPGDPAQAKMMMLMPVIFMVIFINFSSGLVLYWLVGNLISITQQYFTQKKLA